MVYLAVSVRNVGSGLAVLHGWDVQVGLTTERSHPPLEDFTTQNLDIYVAPGDNGLWLSALRDPAADIFTAVTDAFKAGDPLVINLLYGDFEGGQRVITQITRAPRERALAGAGHQALQRGPARSPLGPRRACPRATRLAEDRADPLVILANLPEGECEEFLRQDARALRPGIRTTLVISPRPPEL